MAEVMLGRIVKHKSPPVLTDQSASGMSMSMGGGAGMGSMGGMMGGQGEAAAKLGKKLQDAAAAAMAANRPRFSPPSWR